MSHVAHERSVSHVRHLNACPGWTWRRRAPRASKVLAGLAVGSLIAACGSGSHPAQHSTPPPAPSMTATSTIAPTLSPTPQPTSPPTKSTPRPTGEPQRPTGTPPVRPHVLLIMLENKGYGATLGSCTADRYLCSLASQYVSATA